MTIIQRMASIANGSSPIASYGYDTLGRRSSIGRNGVTGAATGYTWDGADRLATLSQSLTGTAAVTWTQAYDPAGGLVSSALTNTAYAWHPVTGPITGYVANDPLDFADPSGMAVSGAPRQSRVLKVVVWLSRLVTAVIPKSSVSSMRLSRDRCWG
jgi:hypothetical protein